LSTHSSQLFGDKSDSLTECCHLGKDNPGALPSETTQKLRRKGGGIVRETKDMRTTLILLSFSHSWQGSTYFKNTTVWKNWRPRAHVFVKNKKIKT